MLAEYELNRERDENIFVMCEDDGVCPVHFHRKIEVMYVLEGEKKIVAAGKDVVLKKDNIFLPTATKCTVTRRAQTVNRLPSCSPTECCAIIMRSSETNCRSAT